MSVDRAILPRVPSSECAGGFYAFHMIHRGSKISRTGEIDILASLCEFLEGIIVMASALWNSSTYSLTQRLCLGNALDVQWLCLHKALNVMPQCTASSKHWKHRVLRNMNQGTEIMRPCKQDGNDFPCVAALSLEPFPALQDLHISNINISGILCSDNFRSLQAYQWNRTSCPLSITLGKLPDLRHLSLLCPSLKCKVNAKSTHSMLTHLEASWLMKQTIACPVSTVAYVLMSFFRGKWPQARCPIELHTICAYVKLKGSYLQHDTPQILVPILPMCWTPFDFQVVRLVRYCVEILGCLIAAQNADWSLLLNCLKCCFVGLAQAESQ